MAPAPLSIESTPFHRIAAVPSTSESAGEASSAWLTLAPFGEARRRGWRRDTVLWSARDTATN
eukprot:392812-Prymnesium_polylepis.1